MFINFLEFITEVFRLFSFYSSCRFLPNQEKYVEIGEICLGRTQILAAKIREFCFIEGDLGIQFEVHVQLALLGA